MSDLLEGMWPEDVDDVGYEGDEDAIVRFGLRMWTHCN